MSQTIHELVRTHATHDPDRVALVGPGRQETSWTQLLSSAEAIGEALRQRGVQRGSVVACVLPDGPDAVAATIGIASAATCAPLNPASIESELARLLADLDARFLLVESEQSAAAIAAARRADVPVIALAPLLDRTRTADFAAVQGETERNDVALMLLTSGTTSKPKRVPLTHANLVASARSIARGMRLTRDDRSLCPMPLHHIHGLVGGVLSSFSAGGSAAIGPRAELADFVRWVEELGPTWYTAVPTIHREILATSRGRRDSVIGRFRFIRSSSASLPPPLMAEMEEFFAAPVIEAYGMTEASHEMACNPLPPRPRKPGSVGVATGSEVAIIGTDGSMRPANETGEVVVRGPCVMSGYHGDRDTNAAAWISGWFRTGDQGHLDSDGYLFLTGRLKEMINRGGEQVSPFEVEAALSAHPAVAEVIAFPVPHPTLGEDVAAAVVLAEGMTSTDVELRAFTRHRLARFKAPRRILFVTSIPRSATGKVQRLHLAEILRDALEAAREEGEPEGQSLTKTEVRVRQIWREFLSVSDIGIHDDFFALGGDSLTAVRLVNQVNSTLESNVSLFVFVAHPTVNAMAAQIDAAALVGGPSVVVSADAGARLVQLQPGADRRPVFFFSGGVGDDPEFVTYARLARAVGAEYPFYGFRNRAVTEGGPAGLRVEEMAEEYIREIRALQPEGPYTLVGECAGGFIAYEVAREMRERGMRVGLLALMATPRPNLGFDLRRRLHWISLDVRRSRYVTRVAELLRRVRDLEPGELLPKLLTKSARAAKAVARKVVTPMSRPTVPSDRLDFGATQRAFSRAIYRFRARAYAGKISLIVDAHHYAIDPTMGWSPLVTRLEIHSVPGTHRTYLVEHAQTTASRLRAIIESAERGA